ncbi:hypothetical protein N2152v2_000340 [Parachlorella kessleri]
MQSSCRRQRGDHVSGDPLIPAASRDYHCEVQWGVPCSLGALRETSPFFAEDLPRSASRQYSQPQYKQHLYQDRLQQQYSNRRSSSMRQASGRQREAPRAVAFGDGALTRWR